MIQTIVVAIAAGIIALGIITEAWVLTCLWVWFLVPMGAPVVSIPVAVGVTTIASLLTHQYRKSADDEWPERAVAAFMAPMIFLLIGWVAKQFI